MRLLVTGGGGQLATAVIARARRAGYDLLAPTHGQLDITDRDQVRAAVLTWRPTCIVNAAGWTAVDDCEADPARAMAVNGLAVRWLAEAADSVGAHLVHVSTDYVFDGTLHRPYHEWDDPNPQSVYGVTKLAGEREAVALGAAAAVVRTSWLCSVSGSNMVRTVLRLSDGDGPLRFVDDQIGHPTFAADLAEVLDTVASRRMSGVIHATNQGAVSWYEFARAVLSAAGRPPDRVEPVATADLRPVRPARRPANSVLDNQVLHEAGVPLLRDFREPLAEVVTELLGGGTSR